MHFYLYKQKEFYKLFQTLDTNLAQVSAPRGQKTRELRDMCYTTYPFVRFCTHPARKYSMDYLKREWAWYVRANPYDLSIVDKAKAWGPMVKDGKINSNYGAYWFGQNGVDYIVDILAKDIDSRRAVIPMYGAIPDHTDPEVRDVPCTLNAQFMVRHDELVARYTMRSQDVVFGAGNDIPTFSFLQEVICELLSHKLGRDIYMGRMTVTVGSFHVYERHFNMLKALGGAKMSEWPSEIADEPPAMCLEDALAFRDHEIVETTEFGRWLCG